MGDDEKELLRLRQREFTDGPYSVVVSGVEAQRFNGERWYPSSQGAAEVVHALPLFRDLTFAEVDEVVQRAFHIEPEVVLVEASQDDAISVKMLLESRCAKVKIQRTPTKRSDRGNRSISVRVRREVWRRDDGRCVDCESRVNLEFDHIVPFSKGGSNTARNVELRCETCNRKKAARI